MCGIAGLWNINGKPIDRVMFGRFTDTLAHRGPDGRGVYIASTGTLALGHTRLAILDLSPAGHQPMSYAHGRYWITFNGEIYNFLELREELAGLGHTFVSESDTEVILAAYVQWGEACQLKFNGMWGLAIWDCQERILFLSRDRFGIKPLHYIYTDKYLAFASEMKAFLKLDFYDCIFDHEIMTELLSNINGLEGTEHTILRGVKRLVGGHSLTIREGEKPHIRQWWNTLEHLEQVPASFEEQTERFRELFFDACKLRMRSDVPLATSLSGGLDSSAVLCSIHTIGQSQRFTKDWQKAFVACFPNTNLDELQYARQVVEAKKAIPFYNEINISDDSSDIEKIIYQFEDIYCVHLASVWHNYKAMRDNGIVVSLDGHGADELMGGYHFIVEQEMENVMFHMLKIGRYLDLRKTLKGFEGGSNIIDTSYFNRLISKAHSKYKHALSNLPFGPLLKRMYRQIKGKPRDTHERLNYQEQLLKGDELKGLTHLNKNLFVYFHQTVLPTILRNFDRGSMAHGIEIRMPFMDWRLVCFLFSLPDESKIGAGYAKRILREAMLNIIPDSIRTRTNKIGFTSPMPQWFEGPLRGFLLDTVSSSDFLSSDIVNGRVLREFVETQVRKQEWASLESIWPSLNAYILVKQFNQHRTSSNKSEK